MNFGTESQALKNEPIRDFSLQDEREKLNKGLREIRNRFPLRVFPIINGKTISVSETHAALNPANLSETVATIGYANRDLAEQAVSICSDFSKTWKERDPSERSAILRNAARILRKSKDELTALILLEVGKGVKDTDAEIAEAIDFCEFYAQESDKLAFPRLRNLEGEDNAFLYRPRGVTAIIAPWNFPLAILCGMTVAPLVTGNTVIMKPAEQSSAIAWTLFKILIEAGVPAEALQFLPGKGEEIGSYLVNHPKVHTVNFTGSRAVGLQMIRETSGLNLKFIKRVVAEMGGKNAIIVDEDADLDEAVAGALQSAFGFQGQKCSALSRLIVLDSCYDIFRKRFSEALLSLKAGPPEDPSTKIGPVIDAESKERIERLSKKFDSNIYQKLEISPGLKSQGHFVDPLLLESDDFNSELGQSEFFAPIVTLFKVRNFKEAIAYANGVDYALTGGIYSRNPNNIILAKNSFEVGNLYINRSITGAIVDRQPFGGFKLSGVGAKAGGPDYLKQFLEPVCITENTMRRGFIPEL
ncbi:putative delta-1-pyrroline-5-carboxylate dehydrogenase [Leptospira inadai serovar Lyme str. 10]|uniref:L-glutamate gamma-semialdehyde dehydrogenase n=2 Tax=Leptospira inadai serovar Lyme TaxID=293084 RepID=V6HA04_9LEPT|nr:aldehyde dehydrogenase family protein [Leptospira inadai]EQA35108.1 putative delta-1-pyrroline-5-carboxylate dehydrogenase [Leptospira inadai serovar Lyme str. 10]PNV76173.1 1-pyrroline-5-carboxylate dehydrogenase [Leptospira inadai serovar Lyme]